MTRIFVFGGSSVYGCWDSAGGWVQRLRTQLEKNSLIEVFNLGIYGDSTKNVRDRFILEVQHRLRLSTPEDKIILIFQVGTNDTQFLADKGKRRTEKDLFTHNIQDIINKAQTITNQIVFLGLSLVDESKTQPITSSPNISFDNATIQEYDDILHKICKTTAVAYVKMVDVAHYFHADGIHQNEIGHQKIAEEIHNALLTQSWLT